MFSGRGLHLFDADGLHLNRAVSQVLTANLAFGVLHARIMPVGHPPESAQVDQATLTDILPVPAPMILVPPLTTSTTLEMGL